MKIQTITLFAGLVGLVAAGAPRQCGGNGYRGSKDCPQGYECTGVNDYYKECTKLNDLRKRATPDGNPNDDPNDDPNGNSDDDPPPNDPPTDNNSTFTPVIGSEEVYFRLPVQELQEKFPDVFNMYILALEALQLQSESSDLSYYGLAGIHGAPFIAWQEPPKENAEYGYCTHDSVIFCTWHRPYLLLMEQQLIKTALSLADDFHGDDAERYTEAAKKIRLPYWDWADSTQGRIPDIVSAPQITVIKPSGSVTIPNPLYSYHFTNDEFRTQFFEGFPQQAFTQTLRQPTGTPPVSREDLVNEALLSTFQARKDGTFQLFAIENFSRFSSTRFPSGAVPLDWASVEGLHDQIHGIVGTGGHMGVVPVAAFDPIFWLHHAQVDRLGTIYQAIHPGSNIEPLARTRPNYGYPEEGGVEDINTLLYPFKHQDNQYWTSNDVSTAESTHKYGYAYPEAPTGLGADELKDFASAAVKLLYGPNKDTPNFIDRPDGGLQRTEWLAHITFDEAQIDGTFTVWVYIGDVPAGHHEGLVGESLVGGCASFSGGVRFTKQSIVAGTVPLTQALADKGVPVSGPKEDVVAYLKKNLKWKVMRGTEEVPTSALPTLEIGVSASDTKYYSEPEKLPEYGTWSTYYDATKDKEGGLKPDRGHVVGSEDINFDGSSNSSTVDRRGLRAKRFYSY